MACNCGISVGFSTAILTTYWDIETDRAAGRKNLIILFGYKFGVAQYYFCIISALLIPVIIVLVSRKHYLSLICLAAIFLK